MGPSGRKQTSAQVFDTDTVTSIHFALRPRCIAAVLALLLPCLLGVAAADSCAPTVTSIDLPTARPSRCLAVRLKSATVVLNLSLVRAHARGTLLVTRWNMRLANELLEIAPSTPAAGDCAHIGVTDHAGWLGYVANEIDSGNGVVYPADSDPPVPVVTVRNNPGCGFGSVGTRGYFLPGGKLFLALVTSVS
jgi:hypothetical protein